MFSSTNKTKNTPDANKHLVILFTTWTDNRQRVPRQLRHPHLHLHPCVRLPKALGFTGNNSQRFSYLHNFSWTTTLLPCCLLPQLAELTKEAACETFKC